MSESFLPPHRSEAPCAHCGTALYDEVRFCFECGAPVVPELNLPNAPSGALEEFQTAAFSPVSIRPLEDDEGLRPGEPIEIESLGFEVVVDEVPIDMDDDDVTAEPAGVAGHGTLQDPEGTVVSMAPEHPLPFWPAPAKGGTVVAPAPTASSVAG